MRAFSTPRASSDRCGGCAPIQLRTIDPYIVRKGGFMRGNVWVFGGAVVVTIVAGLVAQHATAQATRPQVPVFEADPLWSQALPNKWVNGQIGGVAVDSHDNVWVFHRPATIPDGEKAASLN